MEILKSPAGKVVRTLRGYDAFIPNPLPPQIEWNDTLVHSLSRADLIIGKLAGEGSRLPNPQLLMRPFITREAVLSSRIEGTQASISEVLADEVGAPVDRSPADLLEVRNYIFALDYGLKLLNDIPLSLRLIKEIHKQLMQGVRGHHATPGEFRRSQNWIGLPGCTLATAKYVPPPPEDLLNCLSAFELFLHSKQLPPLIHIALCHYQFEAIHPFLDGNGRVGRLLITLLIIEQGILPAPLLYLSAFFEATRDEYYRQLYNVSRHGNWQEWLIYFLNGVAIQSRDVLSRAERINQLIENWTLSLSNGSSSTLIEIIKNLVANPFITAKKISEHNNIAFTTALRNIKKLESLGIISLISKNKRNRVYCALKLIEILEEPARTDELE
ncbi:MAG: Adenosine monophosphate-protein transferase SoFic [Chlamydiae bacterium]|nr:Adenosine monophosphate-protein transferase SoFic [Chlamydiota bacterium]